MFKAVIYLLATLAMVIVITGCAPVQKPDSLDGAIGAAGKAQGQAELAVRAIEGAKRAPVGMVDAWLDAALNAARAALESITQTQAAHDTATARIQVMQADNVALKSRVSVLESNFFSVRQHKLIWWAVGLIGLAIVLRAVALGAKGGWGEIAAWGAHGIIGLITGGASLILTIGDNLWFRVFGGKAK